MTDGKFRVSQSKVKTYRKCRAAYSYKYVEKLRAKRKPRALTFGSMIHKMIEVEAEGDDPFDVIRDLDPKDLKLFASEKAEYGDLLTDVRRIMTEYFDYWDEDPLPLRFDRIRGKSAEHSFDIEILPDVVWNGKIDARGKRDGLRWLIEHKSFKRRSSDDDRWRNLQSVSYFRAMDMLGWTPVDGTCWDYIWSKPPAEVSLLKNGEPSQKSAETLPIAVKESLVSHGFKPKEYLPLIKRAESNRPKWFYRVYTRVDQDVSQVVFDQFVDTIKEMVDNHGKKSDMNIERHCSWCDFEALCRARLQGLDYDFIKERNYEKSEAPDSEPDHTIHYEEERD